MDFGFSLAGQTIGVAETRGKASDTQEAVSTPNEENVLLHGLYGLWKISLKTEASVQEHQDSTGDFLVGGLEHDFYFPIWVIWFIWFIWFMGFKLSTIEHPIVQCL